MSENARKERTGWHPPTTGDAMAERSRELFERAKQVNDPENRDILSAAAWYWADRAERKGVYHSPPIETCPKCGAKGIAFICSEPGCPVNGGADYG